MKYIFTIVSTFILSFTAFGQEEDGELKFNYKGFADSYHATKTQDNGNMMSSRTRLRFEGCLEKNDVSVFVSLNAIHNSLLKEQTGFFLREAFINYQNNGWNMKIGRQIITWGVADGLQLTDIISPMDYTEFLAQDYDDIRIPVTALRLSYSTNSFHIESIFVPISEFFVLPTDTINPWSVKMNGLPCSIKENRPSYNLKNSEFGIRSSFCFSGIDFSLCALQTYNKMPAFTTLGIDNNNHLQMNADYGRMTMIGGDISLPIGKFVIRGEAAEYFNTLQTISEFNTKPIKKDQSLALVGVDWYPGHDWTIMFQYQHTYISNYDNNIHNFRNSGLATINLKKELLRNMLKISTFGRIDCSNNGAFFTRFNAEYLITDQITLTVGYDWFNADAGIFAMYKDNSEFFFKARFSF